MKRGWGEEGMGRKGDGERERERGGNGHLPNLSVSYIFHLLAWLIITTILPIIVLYESNNSLVVFSFK